MNSYVRLFLSIAACGLATAVATAAAAGSSTLTRGDNGAERIVEEYLYELDGLYLFPCSEDGELLPDTDGELIDMDGAIYERITLTIDGSGEYHYRSNTMPIGVRGVGLISGEEFRVRESDKVAANQRLEGGTGSYREELTLVGRDTHRSYRLVSTGHYVIAADGTIKVSKGILTTECRP